MSSTTGSVQIRAAVIAAAILSSGLLGSCSKAPKQALRLGLVPGDTYVLSVRVAADAVLTSPDGNNVPIPATSLNTFVLQAGDVDERGNTFISAQAGDSEFPLIFLPLAAIFKGYSFGFKLTPGGRIAEFINTDAMREAIRSSLLAISSGASTYGSSSLDSVIGLISDDCLRAMIEPITSIWPEAPVAPGDEWTGPAIFAPVTQTITTAKYRLESLDDAEAIISVETEIRASGDAPRDPTLPPAGTINGNGTGEIHVDPLRGLVRSYEVNQQTAGTISAPPGGPEFKITGSARIQAELTAR